MVLLWLCSVFWRRGMWRLLIFSVCLYINFLIIIPVVICNIVLTLSDSEYFTA
jgi:hypothetical protein